MSSRPVGERLKELKQIEKRLLDGLLKNIAKAAIKGYDPKTKTIDTDELAELISANWSFLSKKYRFKKKVEVKDEASF